MNLDKISLQPFMLERLYQKSLIEQDNIDPITQPANSSILTVLGKNQKKVVIVVNDKEADFINADELNFLLGILAACSLTMEDVCILNMAKNENVDYTAIVAELKAEKIFLFGVDSASIKLPLAFPDYQVQQYNNKVYLSAPSLPALRQDKKEKTKLWNCLKQVFSI